MRIKGSLGLWEGNDFAPARWVGKWGLPAQKFVSPASVVRILAELRGNSGIGSAKFASHKRPVLI